MGRLTPVMARLFGLLAIVSVTARPLGAQAARAEQAGSPRSALPSAASLSVGARLRLTLVDSVLFGRDEWRANPSGHVVGSFVALEPATVHVLLSSGDTMSFPSTSVRRLEVSDGPGACQTSDAATLGCDVGVVLGAALLGAWTGDRVARHLQEEGSAVRDWRLRGGLAAGLLTLPFLPFIGRDRWIQVADWPAPGSR